MGLRLMNEDDLPLVLSWRNAPQVRNNMYTSHEISWAEHLAWFAKNQKDLTTRNYMYIEGNKPCGVVNFTNLCYRNGNSFWGFYAGTNAPKGVGLRIEYEALMLAFSDICVHKLNCEVIAYNRSVINMHKKVGFKEEGVFRDFHYDGVKYHDVVRLGILYSEWYDYAPLLAARIGRD